MSFVITSNVGHSAGVSVTETSTSSDGTTVEGYTAEANIAVGNSSSSDEAGMAIAMGGDATAVGTDTLAVAVVSAVLAGDSQVQVAHGSMSLLAAGEGESGAYASTSSYMGLTGNADRVFTMNVVVTNFVQAPDSSAWYSSSESTLFALDIDASPVGDTLAGSTDASSGDASAAPDLTPLSALQPESASEDPCGCSEPDLVFTIDGNLAWFEVDILALSEDSLASADLSAITVEDQLSSVVVAIVLAIE